jgi:hypothetical protein
MGGAPIRAVLESQPKPPAVIPSPSEPPKPMGGFWGEFLRVQIDKFILLALVVFLYHVGDKESMKYAIGGLIVAINHNRFRWN